MSLPLRSVSWPPILPTWVPNVWTTDSIPKINVWRFITICSSVIAIFLAGRIKKSLDGSNKRVVPDHTARYHARAKLAPFLE